MVMGMPVASVALEVSWFAAPETGGADIEHVEGSGLAKNFCQNSSARTSFCVERSDERPLFAAFVVWCYRPSGAWRVEMFDDRAERQQFVSSLCRGRGC